MDPIIIVALESCGRHVRLDRRLWRNEPDVIGFLATAAQLPVCDIPIWSIDAIIGSLVIVVVVVPTWCMTLTR